MNVPDDLRYTSDHEWARLEGGRSGSGSPTTPRMRSATWSSCSCPSRGRRSRAGDSFSEVESTKSVSDVYAPLAGHRRRGQHRLATPRSGSTRTLTAKAGSA